MVDLCISFLSHLSLQTTLDGQFVFFSVFRSADVEVYKLRDRSEEKCRLILPFIFGTGNLFAGASASFVAGGGCRHLRNMSLIGQGESDVDKLYSAGIETSVDTSISGMLLYDGGGTVTVFSRT